MKPLLPREEQVMQILWRLEKAFVREILEEMGEPRPPVTTLSSLVRKMEDKGLVGHESFGKAHRYYPILKKSDYRKRSFKKLLQQYFEGSPEELLSFFVKEGNVEIEDMTQLLEQIKKKEKND
jgi:BlaI family penicillinase repressor